MPETPSPADASAFDALRERGVDRRDPVRFHLAESLARRAAVHAGAVRRVLDDKLAALMDQLAGAGDAKAEPASMRPPCGLLAELVAHASRRKTAPVLPAPTKPRGAAADKAPAGPAADPKTLQFFKRTWSRLSAQQRLAQSRASLPGNAGPLNSQHLVHRSLTLMHELSPEYLERFVGYIDALQWLEQSNEAATQEALGAARPGGGKKSMPARRQGAASD
jgi:hypothetical protein